MTNPIDTVSFHPTHARHDKVNASGGYRWAIVLAYFVAATIALATLAFMLHNAGPLPIDLAAARAVQSVKAGGYDLLMRAVGEPGYPPQVYVLVLWILGVLYFAGLKWEMVMEVFANVGIGVVGLAIKMLVDRPRPSPELITVLNPALDGGKYSFPAGHVEADMAIIGFLLFLSITLPHKYAWTRVVEIIGFGMVLALIGISRVYTGEHWLTDALGGYLLGSLWLILTIGLYQWGKPRFFESKGRASGRHTG